MPEMREGESQSGWMGRCVPYLKDEGKNQEQAVGQCLGMWRSKHGGEKPSAKLFSQLEKWELDALERGHGLKKDATVQSGHVTTAIGNSGTRGSKNDRKAKEFNQLLADQSENDLTNYAADINAGETLSDDEYATGNDIIKGAWSLPIKIEKTNADKQQIFGWAYVSEDDGQIVVDKQGDIIPIEELEKAAYSYLLDSRDGGDMHERRGVMSTIESVVFTKDKEQLGIRHDSGRYGWWVGFQVHDATLWKSIKAGTQLELSIGGASFSQEVESVDTWLKNRDVFAAPSEIRGGA